VLAIKVRLPPASEKVVQTYPFAQNAERVGHPPGSRRIRKDGPPAQLTQVLPLPDSGGLGTDTIVESHSAAEPKIRINLHR
jgi:hypothetical protein